jgi:hypothetical protein
MSKQRLVFSVLAVILILALPSVALADEPVRFETQLYYDAPLLDCGDYVIRREGFGVVSGSIHYDQDGQAHRTFKHFKWDIRYYSPETGKELWGMCNLLNHYEGAPTTSLRATGVVYHVTAPHYGIAYIGAGQLVFSTPYPDASAIIKEVGIDPFSGAHNQLCRALAP